MEVSTAELKVCLASWQKHLADSIAQRDLIREHKYAEAEKYNVSLAELRALDIHCLDLLSRLFPSDSQVLRKWHIYEPLGDLMMDSHIAVAGHKVGVLKLAVDLLEGRTGESSSRPSKEASPTGYAKLAEALAAFRSDVAMGCDEYDRNVFVMTRFQKGNKQLDEIDKTIRTCLAQHGLRGHRADDKVYPQDRNLWDNVCTYMIGCKYGLAVLEDVIADEFNPNVALEYGFMRALSKPTLLLKERRFKLRADILGTVWEEFDIFDIEPSINPGVSRWLSDLGVSNTSAPSRKR